MKNNGWYEYLLSKKVSSLNKTQLYDLSVNLMNEAMKIHDIDMSNKKASPKQQTYFKDRWSDLRNALGLKPNQTYVKKNIKRDAMETNIELLKSYLYDRTGITEKERLEKQKEQFDKSWSTFQSNYMWDNDSFTIDDYREFIDTLSDLNDLIPEFDDSAEILSMFEYYKSNTQGNNKTFVKMVYDEYKQMTGKGYTKSDLINSVINKMGGS